MPTRGDLYLRTPRTMREIPFAQHFTICHDACPSYFLKVFRQAYKQHQEEGYPLENCIALLHPCMLEANADVYGGFFANLDMVSNHVEIGYKFSDKRAVYFKGTIEEFLEKDEGCFEYTAFEEVHVSDFYDDSNNGYVFGVHYGTYTQNRESIDINPEWFQTEREREIFIKDLEREGYVHTDLII